MHPVLLEIGGFRLYSYGVLIATAFLLALAYSMREAKRRGLPHQLIPDLGFWIVLGALAGSRLLYVLLNISTFLEDPLKIFAIWSGGFVFLGGAILGGLLGYLFLKRRGQPILPWLDAMAPGIALGQGVGRIGCLMAGCCYGAYAPTLPWAIRFTDPLSLAPLFHPLHPTQLYHSLASFFIFFVLMVTRRKFETPGRQMGLFLALYASFRIFIEFFRGDYRGYAGPISVTQLIALAFGLLGVYLLARRPKAC
ncbi:MAG: phosphatidylglycerol---prolipoprotein diacylglyceryl transferase [Desulfovibrionales bacterium]|nr:phosphatidylglycerol---prolipoprotein diacylglyceryl transferase [Desulfovibrionales bacterium]